VAAIVFPANNWRISPIGAIPRAVSTRDRCSIPTAGPPLNEFIAPLAPSGIPMIAFETESTLDSSIDDLARRVALMLARQLGIGSERIHVAAHDGQVVLSGRVGSYYRRQLALAGARRVAGVRSIVDQIEVLPWPA
jgi:BON domain-containing protein